MPGRAGSQLAAPLFIEIFQTHHDEDEPEPGAIAFASDRAIKFWLSHTEFGNRK